MKSKYSTSRLFLPTAMTLAGLALLASQSAQAASGTWNVAADGNWSDAGSWNGGLPASIADGATFTATFTPPAGGTGTTTTTLDTSRTIGNIGRGNSGTGVQQSWLITSPTNVLTLDFGASNSNISNGTNNNSLITVDTDILLNSNLVLSGNGNNNAKVTLGAAVGGHTITGSGNITVNNTNSNGAGAITINDSINTSGAIFNTSTQGHGHLIAGIIGSSVTGVTQRGAIGLSLTGANLYTSATTVGTAGSAANGGRLTVSGLNGTINLSSSYTINGSGSNLNLDYTGVAAGAVDRVGDGTAITLNRGGELRMAGAALAVNSTETIGTLTLGSGLGIVSVSVPGTGVDTLTSSGIARGAAFATGLIRGSNLGTGASSTGRVILTDQSGLNLIGTSTTAGATNLNISPYLMGDTSGTGVGRSFLTYDTNGLRSLTLAEVALITTAAAGDNVRSAAGANNLTGAKTFNSLLVGYGATAGAPASTASTVTGDGSALNLTSGALANIATGAAGSSTLTTFSSIIFGTAGANEAVITNTNATAGGNLTIDSPINTSAAGGGLTKSGGGNLILSGSNLYTGQTTVNQGTLQIGTGTTGDLGGNTSGVVLNGGSLLFARTDAGLTIPNTLSGFGGGVTQNGVGGTTTLTGTNSYTDTTTVTAGTLNLNNTTPQTLGALLVNNGTLNINGNTSFTTLQMSAGAFTSLLNVNNGGTLNLSGSSLIGQNNSAANATLRILSGGTVNVSGIAQFVVGNAASPNTPTGVLTMESGSALTLIGTGSFQIATITALGTVNLDGGMLTTSRNVTGASTTGTSTFNFNGGTLKSGAAFTMSGLTTANVRNGGAIIDTTGGTITMTQALLHSNIGGDNAIDGGVTVNGSGLLTLSATNTYTGGTIINNGSTNPTVAGALGSGTVTINSGATLYQIAGAITYPNDLILAGGTFRVGGGATKSVGTTGNVTLTADSTINADGGTLGVTLAGTTVNLGGFKLSSFANGTTNTISAAITGVGGSLEVTFGTLRLSGANTYTGQTTITAGTLLLNANDVIPDTSNVSIAAATLNASTRTDTAGTLDVTAAATINLGAAAALAFADSSAVDWTGGTLAITGTFVSGASLRFGTTSGGLTATQLGLITATGFSTFALNATGYLTATAVGGYSAWQTANSTSQTINLDHDNDGVSNGVEFFLGGSTSTTGFTALPGVIDTAGVLSVTWPKAATYTGTYGTDFFVETSATLGAGSWTTETLGVNVVITGNNVKYTFPAGTVRFARLKVTGP